MKELEIRLFGWAFWQVCDGVTAVDVETKLWLPGPYERPDAGLPAQARGRRRAFCTGCASEDFARVEIAFLTVGELAGLECLRTEVEDLRKALTESPESFRDDVRKAAQDYVNASDEAAAQVVISVDELKRKSGAVKAEILEGANAELVRQACLRVASVAGLTRLIDVARQHRIREWQKGTSIPPPLPGRDMGLLDPYGAPKFVRLTCADCGRWTVLLPLGTFDVPEEWWENPEVPNPEAVRVEFDAELARPMACILDGVPVDVIKTEKVVRKLLPEAPPGRPTAAGEYQVVTSIGELTLEAVPTRDESGQPDWEECQWRAEFRSEAAARKWRELKRDEAVGAKVAAYQAAERRVRLSERRSLNERAYGILYHIETSLRARVLEVLDPAYRPDHGHRWWETAFRDFLELATRRRPGSEPGRAEDVLEYLTLPELAEVVTKRWPDLKEEVGVPFERFKGWIQELTEVRNDVMHNRPLDKREFDHLMTYADLVRGCLRPRPQAID